MEDQKYPLRALPWWTPDSVKFISRLMTWYPEYLDRRLTALEVGSGNSTFYLLDKGIQVLSIETDRDYIDFVKSTSEAAGYEVQVVDNTAPDVLTADLTIVYVSANRDEEEKPGFWFNKLGLDFNHFKFDLVINDGTDRMFFLNAVRQLDDVIVIIDNVEYAANWGRLNKSSAKPDLINIYRSFFRSNTWSHYIFEQPEGRDTLSMPDAIGFESVHRWISSVSWSKKHTLNEFMVSHVGLPLVNEQGLRDVDVETLSERCPYNWEENKWELNDEFPQSLNLGLKRSRR